MAGESTEGPTLGIDLGGTKIATALVSADGEILASHREETDAEEGPERVFADIRRSVERCLGGSADAATAVGLGVAGQVDTETGVLKYGPNLGWTDVPLADRLREALGLPVAVTNDVRAAARGEWHHGAGRGADDLVCIFVGTGIGGGVVAGGRILRGSADAAGELGHLTIMAGGRPCRCPNRGCFEAYAGGWAIAERTREAVRDSDEAGRGLVERAGAVESITAEVVGEAFRAGDDLARRIIAETAEYLAAGLTGIVNAFNPRILILGGGVVEGLPIFLEWIEPIVRDRALEAVTEGLELRRAELGGHAGVVGAASLAREAAE